LGPFFRGWSALFGTLLFGASDLFEIWCLKFGASHVPNGHFSARLIYSPPRFLPKRLLPNDLPPKTPNYSPPPQVSAPNGDKFDPHPPADVAANRMDKTTCLKRSEKQRPNNSPRARKAWRKNAAHQVP
jgi:hypothetical protein